MPLEIEGVTYYSAADVCRDLQVSRQTLWRWRNDRRVPVGRRYRGRQILFTEEEVAAIRDYANRLEPAESSAANQLKLFTPVSPKRSGRR